MAIGKSEDKQAPIILRGVPLTGVNATAAKTKSIPYAPGMPTRCELSDLQNSKDAHGQKQWTMFVLALEQFKAMPASDKNSFFQIAGIHGWPQDHKWDDVDAAPGSDLKNGYCHHNRMTFPTWHRPYLMLYEQRIWEEMVKIIEKDKLDDTYKAAANTWRLPYWDWARRDSQNQFSMPPCFVDEQVTIYLKGGPTKRANPLLGFVNPEKGADGKPRKFNDMPQKELNIHNGDPFPWGLCTGVSRHGVVIKDNDAKKKDEETSYTGLEGINNHKLASEALQGMVGSKWKPDFLFNSADTPAKDKIDVSKLAAPGNLADAVNRMFTQSYTQEWDNFATTQIKAGQETEISTGYLSIEYIHNVLHFVAGGGAEEGQPGGQMGDVPVAAFDPLFWMHHCNIDRLFAMWQALNWDQWGKDQGALAPFRKDQSRYWNADEVRDWTKCNYQYDTLAKYPPPLKDGTLDEETYKSNLLCSIQKAYPGTLQFLVQSVLGDNMLSTALQQLLLGAQNLMQKTWDDYLINVTYDRYALGGCTYTIQFWLGSPNDSAATIRKGIIGCVHNFGGMAPGSCDNCTTQKGQKVFSKAQIPITIALLLRALDRSCTELTTLGQGGVDSFLQKSLQWRFVKLCGTVVPASKFPDTKISVWKGTGGSETIGSSSDKRACYGGYKPLSGPTSGKACGLKAGDKLLDPSKTHFRPFQIPGLREATGVVDSFAQAAGLPKLPKGPW